MKLHAFALSAASFWVGIVSTVRAVLRRPATFVVTPKRGNGGWQPVAVAPALAVAGLLVGVSAWGIGHDPSPGVLNGVAFALIHAVILLRGCAVALPSAYRNGGPPARERDRAGQAVVGRYPVVLAGTRPAGSAVAPPALPLPERARRAS